MAIAETVETVLDRIGDVQAGRRVNSDAAFSDPFVRDHTQFDSFEAFRAASPWSPERDGDLRDGDRERLDAYVARTTDFETFAEMERVAAEEEIIDQVVS
ncbi:MAG: hypothetical protein ABEJ31_15425 [Haloarculaceae archaeon]